MRGISASNGVGDSKGPSYTTFDLADFDTNVISGVFLRPCSDNDHEPPPPLQYSPRNLFAKDRERLRGVTLSAPGDVPPEHTDAYVALWRQIAWQCRFLELASQGNISAANSLPQLPSPAAILESNLMTERIKSVKVFTGAIARAAGVTQVAYKLMGAFGIAQKPHVGHASVVSTMDAGSTRCWRVEFFLLVRYNSIGADTSQRVLVALREFGDAPRAGDAEIPAKAVALLDSHTSVSVVCPTKIIRPELLLPVYGGDDAINVLERLHMATVEPHKPHKRARADDASSESTDAPMDEIPASEGGEACNDSEECNVGPNTAGHSPPHGGGGAELTGHSGPTVTPVDISCLLHSLVAGRYEVPGTDDTIKSMQLHQANRTWWVTSGVWI